jgi:type 1 glutamine amidotransferase
MRVLVLCDDFWHPASTPQQGLAALGNCGFEFDILENALDWSAEKMAAYPLVLLAKSNNISSTDQTNWASEETQEAFKAYVGQGNGLLVVHSGLAGYQQALTLRALIGGVFTHHPAQCPVTIQPQAGHALTRGANAFTLIDEHYFVDLDDAAAHVFLTTTSENGAQPGGWTRTVGKGRVCVLTPGHNLEVWLHPSFQTLLLNALQWCSTHNA